MNARTTRNIEAVAENVWVKIVARAAIICASLSLPFFGWVAKEYMDSQEAKDAAILVSVAQIDKSLDAINAQLAERDLARERVRSEIAVERQRNNDQDRTLERHEESLVERYDRRRYNWPSRPE